MQSSPEWAAVSLLQNDHTHQKVLDSFRSFSSNVSQVDVFFCPSDTASFQRSHRSQTPGKQWLHTLLISLILNFFWPFEIWGVTRGQPDKVMQRSIRLHIKLVCCSLFEPKPKASASCCKLNCKTSLQNCVLIRLLSAALCASHVYFCLITALTGCRWCALVIIGGCGNFLLLLQSHTRPRHSGWAAESRRSLRRDL